MSQEQADPDSFTTPFQLTRRMHRDIYGPVKPDNPDLKASGKVVIVTGAAGGLGFVSYTREHSDTLVPLG